MQLGFIGLGTMGRPMALNLMRGGNAMAVWSRRAESAGRSPLMSRSSCSRLSSSMKAAICEGACSFFLPKPQRFL